MRSNIQEVSLVWDSPCMGSYLCSVCSHILKRVNVVLPLGRNAWTVAFKMITVLDVFGFMTFFIVSGK